jgi:Ca2+-binding RTX toxin-like protein/subtilisin-like proprotein convertase family protein
MVGYKGLAGHVYAADMILDAAGLGDGTGNTKGDADGSDIINISVASGINFDPVLATADRMAALETVSAEGRDGLGAILVAANGDNRGQIEGATSSWSSSKYTISVAAVRADGWVTDYSTQGANLLVSAFADTTDNFGGIYTTDRSGEVGYSDGDYAPAFDGTAAAGAQISGVVALMLEANPDLGWRDVQDILAYSARHVGSNVGSTAANFEEGTQTNGASWFFNAATNWNGGGLHFSNDYGFGLVDAKAAVRLAETWTLQSTSANDIELSYDVDGDGAPVVIDNDTLTLDFVVADNIRLEHASVRLDFASNFPDDVELFLESPNGTRIQLVADEGGGTDFDGVWSFGATGFRGELSAGEWTVIIVDDAGADPTTIRDVKLELSGAAVSDDDLFIFTDEYSNYGGITHSLIHDGGAAGIDTINAAAVSSASDIDLQAGIGVIDFVLVTVSDIENVYTGDGDDQVKGDGDDNLISGGRGDDLLNGRGGDDILMGGLGADTLHGSTGSDTASYADATSAVTVRLYDGFTAGAYAAGDILISIENLTGSDFDDTLYGNADANTLDGGEGNDFLQAGRGDDVVFGGGGKDTLYGHDGNDFLNGGDKADTLYGGDNNDVLRGGNGSDALFGDNGSDTLEGGVGADALDGGAGVDTASYASSAAGVTVRLFDGFTFGGDAAGDTLTSIENLAGSEFDDTLYGNAGANTLDGGAGDDYLQAGRGDDVVRGGTGEDILFGHDGNDFLNGGDQADQLYGGDDNDVLRGGFGGDSLFGEAGDDTLDGGAGSDMLNGGAGVDTASYANSSAGVTVRLFDGFTSGGDAQGDTLISIENLEGSAHDDVLSGNAQNNFLNGGAGDDTLKAGRGNDAVKGGFGRDTIEGHDGNDKLMGEGGDDTIDGGAGNDRAIYTGLQSDYAFSTDAITGELIAEDLRPGGPDGTDRLTDIEELEFGDGSVVAVGALGGASELSVSSLEAGFIYQPSEGAASPTALGQPVKAEPFSWADYDAINPAQFGVSKIIEAEVFEVWAGDGDAVVYEAAHQPVPVSAPEAMDPVILGSLHGDPALRFSDTLDLSVHNAPNVLNGVDRGDGLLRVDVLDDVWAS